MNLIAWASERVWAKRVCPSGTELDPAGIALGLGGRQPTVASDGADFLVAWIANGDVLGSEVTGSGSAGDPTGFAISTSTPDDATPDLAFNAATGGYAIAYATNHRAVVRLLGVRGDGGSPDAGVPDAGVTDGGVPDAGVPTEAGSGNASGGCCSASGDLQAAALLVLSMLRARRRRRGPACT